MLQDKGKVLSTLLTDEVQESQRCCMEEDPEESIA